MCTSYKAGKDIDFRALFDAGPPLAEWREEVYKDYAAPIIRRHIPQGVKVFDTMNCRSESVATKRSFSGAWKARQLCLIPCTAFYEPNYETGKAVRWRIGMADGRPFAIAGLWRAWNEAESTALSFTMLTVNADHHPLMRRFHRPGDEKRSVIIVPPMQYEEWLSCRNSELARPSSGCRMRTGWRPRLHPCPLAGSRNSRCSTGCSTRPTNKPCGLRLAAGRTLP
jgi:SOS response associated peptidase (SRAP)